MVASGALGREKQLFRPTRHPVSDKAAHTALLTEVRAAATGDGPMEPRIATLLALAGPSQLLEVVAPARSDRAKAKQRIASAAQQVPAAAAVTCHPVDGGSRRHRRDLDRGGQQQLTTQLSADVPSGRRWRAVAGRVLVRLGD